MPLVTYTWLAVVLALACAAIGWLGIAGWMATVVVAASLAAHVAGNALGTKLREATDRDLAARRPGRRAASWPPLCPAGLGPAWPSGPAAQWRGTIPDQSPTVPDSDRIV